MKKGVEIEFWTIDQNGRLFSCEQITEELEFSEKEFVKPLFEIKTQPHSDLQSLKEELDHHLKESVKEANEKGLKLVPAGTPLNSGEIETVDSERAKLQEKIIGYKLNHAKRVAGLHIHFEQEDVKKQLNALTALDPSLALTNSSPFYQGERVASSSRNQVYRYRCYEDFPRHGQLWKYVESEEEWEQRMEKKYEELKKAAMQEGVSKEKFEENFTVNDALWNPVRLRKDLGTVEFRAPDTTTPSEIHRYVEEMTRIFQRMQERETELPEFSKLQKLSEKAITGGLNSGTGDYLKKLGFDISEYEPFSEKINQRGRMKRKKAREIRLNLAHKMEKELS